MGFFHQPFFGNEHLKKSLHLPTRNPNFLLFVVWDQENLFSIFLELDSSVFAILIPWFHMGMGQNHAGQLCHSSCEKKKNKKLEVCVSIAYTLAISHNIFLWLDHKKIWRLGPSLEWFMTISPQEEEGPVPRLCVVDEVNLQPLYLLATPISCFTSLLWSQIE